METLPTILLQDMTDRQSITFPAQYVGERRAGGRLEVERSMEHQLAQAYMDAGMLAATTIAAEFFYHCSCWARRCW